MADSAPTLNGSPQIAHLGVHLPLSRLWAVLADLPFACVHSSTLAVTSSPKQLFSIPTSLRQVSRQLVDALLYLSSLLPTVPVFLWFLLLHLLF